MPETPAAFLSYVHFDDENDNGRITAIRTRLSKEVRAYTGEEFTIFQDRDNRWGDNWKRRIDQSIDCATFLIPIITPSFLRSRYCLDELQRFLKRERELKRDDLILPLYYIDCPALNQNSAADSADPVLSVISSRQYFDWRDLRFEPIQSLEIAKALARMAMQVRDAISYAIPRPGTPAVPFSTSGLGAYENDALSPIIRQVQGDEPVDFANQNKIEVLKGNWAVGSKIFYLVSHYKDGQKASVHGHMPYTVEARDKDWTLVLRVEYTATTARGLPERIAQKIVDAVGGDHPQAALEKLLTDVMSEFMVILGPSEFISQFDRKTADLIAYVQARIEERAGLNVSLKIIPWTGSGPFEQSRKLGKEIHFRVQDYSVPFTAKLSLNLDAQDSIWPYVHFGALDQLVSEIIATAESFLKMASLKQIVFEMKILRAGLRDELEKLANGQGRTVSRFGLECLLEGAEWRPRLNEDDELYRSFRQ